MIKPLKWNKRYQYHYIHFPKFDLFKAEEEKRYSHLQWCIGVWKPHRNYQVLFQPFFISVNYEQNKNFAWKHDLFAVLIIFLFLQSYTAHNKWNKIQLPPKELRWLLKTKLAEKDWTIFIYNSGCTFRASLLFCLNKSD